MFKSSGVGLMVLAACAAYATDERSDVLNAHADEGYRLVWADEFDYDGPLPDSRWNYEVGFVRNEELQWYTPSAVSCQDGLLVITADRADKDNPHYVAGSENWRKSRKHIKYTSGCVTTKDRHSWLYGRFEIRAKIVTEEGLWPAIWTLGVKGWWPSNGEIDIMEYYHASILANACWATADRRKPKWDDFKRPVSAWNDPNWDDRFHVWRMDWDEDRIALYLDDELLNEIDVTKTFNGSKDAAVENPFRQPHYLLLNLALGGMNGGSTDETKFPSKYLIDYVRVYQKQ